jgi:hypothetical protein
MAATVNESVPEMQVGNQTTRVGLLMGLVNRLKENAAQNFKEAKPWGEMFDRSSLGRPATMAEVSSGCSGLLWGN